MDGHCSADCTGEAGAATPKVKNRRSNGRSPRPKLAPAFTVVAGAGALILLALAIFAYVDLRTSLDDTRTQLRDSQRSSDRVRSDLNATSATLDALSGRLSQVESKLNAHPAAAKLAATARKSVFTIITTVGSGSGWVATSAGGKATLVTDFHVVSDGWVNGDRSVKVRQGDTTYDGTVIHVSEANDLALVRVSHALPVLKVASVRPKVGDSVLALGSPLGLGGTVTSGIVSAFRTIEAVSYMQFSAPISPGNSGGPIIDESGQVVGVTVIKFVGDGAEALGLAIPANRMCDALDIC